MTKQAKKQKRGEKQKKRRGFNAAKNALGGSGAWVVLDMELTPGCP